MIKIICEVTYEERIVPVKAENVHKLKKHCRSLIKVSRSCYNTAKLKTRNFLDGLRFHWHKNFWKTKGLCLRQATLEGQTLYAIFKGWNSHIWTLLHLAW